MLNVGLVCQFQNRDPKAHVPMDELEPYIQDAVDRSNLPTATPPPYGASSAPTWVIPPFNLKYLGIGNEQWGPEYVEHLAPFIKVLREKHPEIKIIGSSGPDSEGKKFDYLGRK